MSIQVSVVDSNITAMPSRTNKTNRESPLDRPLGKGVKLASPFSPTMYSRLVGLQTKAKRFDQQANLKSRVTLHKHITNTSRDRLSNPHDDATDHEDASGGDLRDTARRLGLEYSKGNLIPRSTFHVEKRNESVGQLLKVNPSWREIGTRKSTVDVVDKHSIAQMLKKNSQSFLQKEQQHIKTFRAAQKVQKKNLDLSGLRTHSNSFMPVKNSVGHFTQRHYSK